MKKLSIAMVLVVVIAFNFNMMMNASYGLSLDFKTKLALAGAHKTEMASAEEFGMWQNPDGSYKASEDKPKEDDGCPNYSE